MGVYQKAKLEDGKLIITDQYHFDQAKLTADCWLVQFEGLDACVNCEGFNSEDCGGGLALWALIHKHFGLPPVCQWELAEVEQSGESVDAHKLGQGKGRFGFAYKSAWRRYARRVKDARETRAISKGPQELSPELVSKLSCKVGYAAMVDGFRSNTFGGVVSDGEHLFILSLNTRTFRLEGRRGGDNRLRRMPWLTRTSSEGLEEAIGKKWGGSRHLRFYYGATNAPTQKARQWARDEGYSIVV